MESQQENVIAKEYFKHILLNVVGFYDLSRETISDIYDIYYNDEEVIETLVKNNGWCEKLSTKHLCKLLEEYTKGEEIYNKAYNVFEKRVTPLLEALKDITKFNQLSSIYQTMFKRITKYFNDICKTKSYIYK